MNTTNSKTDKQINIPLSTTSSLHTGSHITPIYLNLYDLGGCSNTGVHSIGLSFYHCAVQTHSTEYGYMGHPYRFTGLYKTSKHDPRFHLYRLRQSIEIGWTWLNEKEIDQIVNDLKPFYLGFDYHTSKKNSIHFAKYLLEQLFNDSQLKHLEPVKILHFPSYVDRARRLSDTFTILQIFDSEKDIAEINILYFLYMKYQGNIKRICRLLQCDTIEKLKRTIELIEQGIRQKKLPIFSLFTTFDMTRGYDYLSIGNEKNVDALMNDEQLTLTEIFHQFDTITLRGRTSIDRYLNIQRTKESENEQEKFFVELPNNSKENKQIKQIFTTHRTSIKQNTDPTLVSHIPRSSHPQSISQNQGRTPLTSPSASNISGLTITSPTIPISIDPLFQFEQLHMRTAVPIGTVLRLQNTPNPNLPFTELRLKRNVDQNSFSLISNRSRRFPSPSRKRKLPRDLELTNNLYTITNPNLLRLNYTNNAIPSFSHSRRQSTINIIIQNNDETDSNA